MATSNYAACIAKVLRYEGGYVNNPRDPGGETNYGITIATARANGYTGSMRAIPMDLVHTIYKKRYWDAVNGDALPAGLDLCVFDFAVNSGPARAKKALVAIGEQGNDRERIHRYCGARLAFLHGLSTWGTFGKGWGSRVADVEATALKMAAAPVSSAPPNTAQAPTVLPTPTATPSTKQDKKEAGWLGGSVATVTGGFYALWGNWAFKLLLFLLVFAALYWFIVRPILRRYWSLDNVETDWLTKIRLALKGVKTKLFAWLLGVAGIALPILSYASDVDLSSILPNIGGVPASVYQYGILALIGWATNTLRNATTTPVGQTDLAIATPDVPPVAEMRDLPVGTVVIGEDGIHGAGGASGVKAAAKATKTYTRRKPNAKRGKKRSAVKRNPKRKRAA